MSWYIKKVGAAKAVADAVKKSLDDIKCVEPENTIKNDVGAAIYLALGAFPPDFPVSVEASGSQSSDPNWDGQVNMLNVKIEPLFGFVK
jgi:hypothetical protein